MNSPDVTKWSPGNLKQNKSPANDGGDKASLKGDNMILRTKLDGLQQYVLRKNFRMVGVPCVLLDRAHRFGRKKKQ